MVQSGTTLRVDLGRRGASAPIEPANPPIAEGVSLPGARKEASLDASGGELGPVVITRISSVTIEAAKGTILLGAILSLVLAIRLGPAGGVLAAGLVICSLLAHEGGHLLAAKLLGVQVNAIGLCLKGAYLRRSEAQGVVSECVISCCGPVANAIIFLLLRNSSPILSWVGELNLVLALSNLAPLPGSDGVRIFRSLRRMAIKSSTA